MGGHGANRNPARSPDKFRPSRVCRIPANSTPLAELISVGDTLWGAFHNDELIAVAVTAPEARAKYRVVMRARELQVYSERKANKQSGVGTDNV
jgi:hypothetical protein